jgi:iron complex outermembrane receptor protein
MINKTFVSSPLAKAVAIGLATFLPLQIMAQGSEGNNLENAENLERIEVTGSLGSLPGQDVEAVFGFGKSILETPRSASTISQEQLERFAVTDIDELVAFAPGTFTQSFFGVAGSLDVRGTPGETYFRGVKRLDNPGNYPTPIGASSRIDIVRGPASPIYGPAKIGGYLNFNPKSARASSGQYLKDNTGAFSYTTGTWEKSIITAELGGSGEIASKEVGFYLYSEVENSGNYYDNSGTDQTILQASFNVDISQDFRIEFGGMYHDYDGNQVAGWNRLTQDLIDNGTYTTGTAKPLDTNGDGSISHQEYGFPLLLAGSSFFYNDPADFTASESTTEMQLNNPGTAKLSGNQVLVAADDLLLNTVETFYFDTFYFTDNNWEIKNQFFYEAYENMNENAYGFSQFHDTWVVEDKLIFASEFETDGFLAQVQISPSLRYTDFKHGDDYTNEYFDRRDLTGPSTAVDRRLLSTRIDDDYTEYYTGNYLNAGFAVMTDLTWEMGLNIVLGARYDTIEVESETPAEKLLLGNFTSGFVVLSDDAQFLLNDFGLDTANPSPENISSPVSASNTFDGVSWNASISFKTSLGLIPYITAAEQATLIAGQGAEVTTANVFNGSAFDTSELFEYGVKGSFLDESLYFALSVYEQQRTDFNAQAIVTNATTKTEGSELELRWVISEQLVISAGYTHVKVYNLTALESGFQFGFQGFEDLVSIDDPSLIYGGNVIGNFAVNSKEDARKAGIPENIFSFTATYDFQNGFALNGSLVKADETFTSFSKVVALPSYTLINAGISYVTDTWTASLNIKNLTDERYFRANFPDLFGAQIVLPELPRHYQAKFSYKF